MTNPSHYFSKVEGFLSVNKPPYDLAILNGLVIAAGCPENVVDSIVNGVIAEVIFSNIPKRVQTLSTPAPKAQTVDELTSAVTKTFNVSIERAQSILQKMIKDVAIEVDPTTNNVYLQRPYPHHTPLEI